MTDTKSRSRIAEQKGESEFTEHAAASDPCPLGDSCPDAHKYGDTHRDPAVPYPGIPADLARQIREERRELVEAQCGNCGRNFHWRQLYRCFDCKELLCEVCMKDHFGNQHEPHPIHMRELHEILEPFANAALESRDAWKKDSGEMRELGVPKDAVAILPDFTQGQLDKLESAYERIDALLAREEKR